MFNKKAKRNFRQRKEESSDEDDGKKDREVENGENETPVSVLRPLGLSKSRGISCSSRRKKIRAARKQRRQARARQDFIPLDGDQHGMEEEAEEDHSEDSDDGTDDHQRTIQFAPKLKTIKERIAETIGGSEDEDDSADSEEENDRNVWEEQQIGKGIKRHKLSSCDYSQGSVKHKKKVDIPETLPAVTIDVIKRRITGKLESLREVHRAREADLRRMQLDMECAQASLEQLQSSSSDEQHRFYKAMRSYVQNLVECLTEKTVVINSVEMDMHTLLIDQAEVLLNRRREAVHKESSHLQQLAYSADPSSNGTEEKQKESQPCNLEAACKGVPADSEPLPDEKAELECKTADILKRAQDIFSDVQDEFSSVKKILAKFNEWRVLYPESYYNAYISFCIPKLLSPIIRHQLIGWNPLKADGEDFEALPWYYAVEDFCHGQGYEELENTDRETLPLIVQKTILPKVQGFVELVWDPLSSEQSLCLTKLCRRLNNDYMVFGGEQSKQGKAFMDAVTVRLRNAVDEDVFIPLYPKKFLEDTSSQQFQFQDRQFWSAVKVLHALLGNITLWDGLVPDNVLMELALDKLLNRYVMMILLNTPPGKESVEKFKKVAACFPKSWFQDVDTRSSIPQLRNFSSHLVQTTHSLCKNNPDATCIRETVKDVFVLLGRIKALNSVATIAEKYHYEDISNSLNLL
ncbi:GC-rich sequence DNA-binding factor 2-like [Scleropages formosus]|uniref:GC-rich sequence DNA-binding factor 2-like n=1 Tax=Scleropages formosus TaxID=113540 RepID=A0A0N8JZC5_SCLFO|nr:GC-rich sequence DNA-binding factor 2-like [Scleropages formosus]